jgi:hypothetical protein
MKNKNNINSPQNNELTEPTPTTEPTRQKKIFRFNLGDEMVDALLHFSRVFQKL